MKTKVLLVVSFVLFLCTYLTQGQEKIYFPYFELINMGEDYELQYATSKLLKTYIEENHDYLIILPKREKRMYPDEDFLESIENAKKYDARYLLLGEINNIGNVAVLSVSLFEVSTGNRIWKDLIKSFPLEDFDPVMSRLGRNFNTATSANDDIEIDDITIYEEEKEMKLITVEANNFTGILLGGNFMMGETFGPRFGIAYSFDISSVILTIDFEYSSNNFFQFLRPADDDPDFLKVRTGGMGLGVILPFYKRKNSFYGDFGLELTASGLERSSTDLNEVNGGLGFYLGTGYLMARTSSANIRFELGFTIPTYTVDNESIYEVKFGIITSFIKLKKNK